MSISASVILPWILIKTSLDMKRGLQTISQIFKPDQSKGGEVEKVKKGLFTDERDECILYRYYYYCQLKQIRFDVALEILEKEFFIGASTLTYRLTVNNEKLKQVVSENKSARLLKKKYPHLNWN